MQPRQPVFLLTGRPGTGKTSLIRQSVNGLEISAGGFYTEEIRHQGTRLGFRLVTLDGDQAILAHVDHTKKFRVGKYGVDVDSLERVGVAALKRAADRYDLVVVDEIGKMEMFSPEFREIVAAIIDSGKRLLGTVLLDSHPWADTIKHRPQVTLITVTRANYTQVREELRTWLSYPT